MEATGRTPSHSGVAIPRAIRPGDATGEGAEPLVRLGTTRHMANLVKDGLAMRLTLTTTRLTWAALLVAWAASAGCRATPYIDQNKKVPHDPLSTVAQEDKDVKQASFESDSTPLSMPLPKLARPRTTSDPEAREIWQLTLQDAIKIGLDNSEMVRVTDLAAQITVAEGFEPRQLAAQGTATQLGGGGLQSIYDPAIQETQISSALSAFDTNFVNQMLWGHSVAPYNNAISAGTLVSGARFPIIFNQDTAQFSTGLQKNTATGATLGITHNISYLYSNSPTNVTPSAYTTNLQLSLTQPLLGSAPLANGFPQSPNASITKPVGLEANRAPILIARLSADASVWTFKSSVQALVRSIEQQYWLLARKHVQHWASEQAVVLAEEILKREQSELEVGRGTVADVAEAQQRLEQFRLDLVLKTEDLINFERQLRNLLGLPPADDRRIVPVSAPTEARLEPDWDASLAQMLTFMPDIVIEQLRVRSAELQLLLSRNQLLPQLSLNLLYQLNGLGHTLDQSEAVMTGKSILAIDPLISTQQRAAGLNALPGKYQDFQQWQIGMTFQMPLGMRAPYANMRSAQYTLLRERAYLQQVVHQTTHGLARYFLMVDAEYKKFKTASRYRASAAERLEAQRAFYEEGRITIDRYLDAVSQFASAVAMEAEYRTNYNIAIVLLEEAKGTLLAYDNIAVAEGPQPAKAYIQARDQQLAHRQFPIKPDGPYHPMPNNGAAVPDPVPTRAPEGLKPSTTVPLLPAPAGPLGPPPTPAPPQFPAGFPNINASAPRPLDADLLKSSFGAGSAKGAMPTVDGPRPSPSSPPPSAVPAPAPAPAAGNDLPTLPIPMELPPLPKE